MKVSLLAVGTRMPDWVNQGVENYRKRLPPEFSLQVQEVPMVARGKGADINRALRREGQGLLSRVGKGDVVVALDVAGRAYSTEKLAAKMQDLQQRGTGLSLMIGGPDGLSEDCLQRADERWSLSALTLPHPLVRILVAEQLYRVWSLMTGHPYHRA